MISQRLSLLREKMAEHDLDAYIVTSADPHSSEYVSDHYKCREYITGFTGSAGTALITRDKAYLWTDSRYFLQAAAELPEEYELMRMLEKGVPMLSEFINDTLAGKRVGADGRTVTAAMAQRLRCILVPDLDLIGEIWEDRPADDMHTVEELDTAVCGESRTDKLRRVREKLGDNTLLVCASDECAWLYNYRAPGKIYDPIPSAYSIVSADRARLYLSGVMTDKLRRSLDADGVEICPYEDIDRDVKAISGTISADSGVVNSYLSGLCANKKDEPSPIGIMKAVKNSTEQQGFIDAHIADGTALTKFICNIKKLCREGRITSYTELDAVKDMERYRGEQQGYIGPSFATIAAYGPHGAIVHYDPDENTNIPCEAHSFLLVDTGGQYSCGTTDVTRTISLGALTDEEKRAYTAVLRGNLALGAAVFPEKVTGSNLDVLARMPLWENGLDYGHGTGHGVGFISCVHEGPNAIRLRRADTPFEEGMVTSNEPGVYITDKFGIRLENLILCRRGGEMYHFLTLTLAPFDRDAIIADMLTDREKKLLNDYHRRVYDTLAPRLTAEEAQWLAAETAPIE